MKFERIEAKAAGADAPAPVAAGRAASRKR
jgi:hypothetical protein